MTLENDNDESVTQARQPRTSVPGMPDDLRPGASREARSSEENLGDELDDQTQQVEDDPEPTLAEDDSDELEQGDEETSQTREVSLSDEELDTPVRFSDGKVVSLRELREGYDNRLDRTVWLQKTNQLANERKRYESLARELGEMAEHRDIPHKHLAERLTAYVKAGLMPEAMLADIDAVWREYEERGEYNRQQIEARAQLEREKTQVERDRGTIIQSQAATQARTEIENIERRFGKQSKETREKIFQVIERSHIANNPMSVTQAFEYLRSKKLISAVPVAQPSARKIEQRLKSATIGRPQPSGSVKQSRSKDEDAVELWDAVHHRK